MCCDHRATAALRDPRVPANRTTTACPPSPSSIRNRAASFRSDSPLVAAQHRNVDDVEDPRIAAVLVLAFVLRYLLMLAFADGPNPSAGPAVDPLPAGDTPPVQLPGVRETDDWLHVLHRFVDILSSRIGMSRAKRRFRRPDHEPQLAVVDHSVLREATGEAPGLLPDDRQPVTSPIHQAQTAKACRCRTTREERHDRLVPAGLPQVQAVRCERVRQRAGNVDLEPILEHVQRRTRAPAIE